MTDGHRATVETIRDPLDRQGSQQYYRPPVQSAQKPLGGFLGKPGMMRLTVLPINLSQTRRDNLASIFLLDRTPVA